MSVTAFCKKVLEHSIKHSGKKSFNLKENFLLHIPISELTSYSMKRPLIWKYLQKSINEWIGSHDACHMKLIIYMYLNEEAVHKTNSGKSNKEKSIKPYLKEKKYNNCLFQVVCISVTLNWNATLVTKLCIERDCPSNLFSHYSFKIFDHCLSVRVCFFGLQ